MGAVDELQVQVLVPRLAVGGLIGKGGASIRQLRETSAAKITIANANVRGPAAEQTVSITGDAQALESVLLAVNREVQALSGESWFASWRATSGATWGNYG